MTLLAMLGLLACGDPGDGGGTDSGSDGGGSTDSGGDGGGSDGGASFEADGEHFGPGEATHCGEALAAAGDVDGDGAAEVWVGCSGNAPDAESQPYVEADAFVALLAGPGTGTGGLDAPSARLDLPAAYLELDADDLDGDGYVDLLAGSFVVDTTELGGGQALLLMGPATGSHDSDSADLRIEGDRRDQDLGAAVGVGIDLSGDGVAELLVAHISASDERVVAVIDGSTRGSTTGDAWPQLRASPEVAAEGGLRMSTPPSRADLDGDGILDLILPASGSVFVIPGGASLDGDRFVDELGLVMSAPLLSSGSRAMAADLDGDGAQDLVVAIVLGSGGEDPSYAGRVWGLAGPFTADRTVEEDPMFTIAGDEEGAYLGLSLDAGDLDGDGQADLVLGMPRGLYGGEDPGSVLRFAGPVAGSLAPGDADPVWTGPSGEGFGNALVVLDLDRDAREDLVVGAPYADGSGWEGGGVYVVLGD